MGGIYTLTGSSRLEKVGHRVDTQEPQHKGIDGRDKCVTEYWIDLVKDAVDQPSQRRSDNSPYQENNRQGDRDVPQLSVDHASHDCLGKNVEKVCSHGQNTFDAGTHEGRRDDKPPAGADATGNQASAKTNKYGYNKNSGAVKGGTVCLLAAQQFRQGRGNLIGKRNPPPNYWNGKQTKYDQPFSVSQNGIAYINLPPCVGSCADHHKPSPCPKKFHFKFAPFPGCISLAF